jgi:Rab proteins geranylgeranyltransferase component A
LKGVIYGTTSLSGSEGQSLLEAAVSKLLDVFADEDGNPTVLWSLRFTQLGLACEDDSQRGTVYRSPISDRIICFPPPSLDISFEDGIIDDVKAAWRILMGGGISDSEFMNFDNRADFDFDS